MGTIVLSPQDCLSSPQNRQNYHFPSAWRPETGRRCSQAPMVPLPAAEDCTRLDYSGGSPPGDGLLPIPQPHGQARPLSKRPSFPAKTPSIFCTPPVRRTTAASPSPTVKPKLSRSTSAILPTPLASSHPATEGDGLHLLKGRLPFKIVQGNGPGNNRIDVMQHSTSKNPVDARNGAHKKISAPNGRVNSKEGHSDGLQGSRSTLKPHHGGTALEEQPKKVDVRNQRNLERSRSVKGPRVKKRVQGLEIPVVTILQRPDNEEAAAELLTKFFQKSTEEVNDEWINCMPEGMRNSREMRMGREVEQRCNVEGLSDFEDLEERLRQTIPSPCSTTNVSGAVENKHVGGSPLADATRLNVSSSDLGAFNSPKSPLEDLMLESVSDDLASWERWAGPSYINSPPPSALPLPRFSRKHLKIESLAAAGLFEETVCDLASTPPPCVSPLYAYFSGKRQPGINPDTVSSATKDLKRILNLDLCRV